MTTEHGGSVDFSIAIVYPRHGRSWIFYEEIAMAVAYSLAGIGYDVELCYGQLPKNRPAILFGLQDVPDLDPEEIPAGSIIYNLEQIVEGSRGLDPAYLDKMRRFEVWDYSARNVRKLEDIYGIPSIRHVPVGYAPVLDRIRTDMPKDVDVLFFGWLNERRRKIIDELRGRGLAVEASESLFGAERDFMISRSRVVLNMHFYTPGIMEVIRIHDLLANHKAVVCERNEDTEIHEGYQDTCVFAPYEELADATEALARDQAATKEQEEKGFHAFARMPYSRILESVLNKKDGQGSVKVSLPRTINAGSGHHFRSDCLNLDIQPSLKPDMVMDLSRPIPFGIPIKTSRFGEITLNPGMFEEIVVNNLLEQVPDLPQAMKNFLDLLEEGGKLRVVVQYDLSLGAWQKPTHVRALNENTWLYFTARSPYLGWHDHHFQIEKKEIILTRMGKRIRRCLFLKKDSPLLLRIPRAVESLELILVKAPTSLEYKLDHSKAFGTFYKEKVGGEESGT